MSSGSGCGGSDAATPPATTAPLTAPIIISTAATIDPHSLPSTAQPTPPTDSSDSSAAPPATTAPSSPPLPLLPTHPTHTTHNPTTGSSPSLPLTDTGDGRDADVLQATQPLPISASTSSSHTVQPVAAVTCQATETAARTPTAIHDTTASPATHTRSPSTSPPTLLLTPADAAAARSEDALQATQPLLFEASVSPHPANTPAAATTGHQTERPAIAAACTRTAPSISTPIPLDFHARLGTRRPSHAWHFRLRFSSPAPLYQCKRFPVYSSGSMDWNKVRRLTLLNDLCLDCIASVLDTRYGTEPEIGDVFFTERLRYRWRRFYSTFYTSQERDEMASWQTAEQHSRRQHYDMQRIVPWLSKRGVRRTCPHMAGTCHDVLCCRGTAKVQAAEEPATAYQGRRAQKKESKGAAM